MRLNACELEIDPFCRGWRLRKDTHKRAAPGVLASGMMKT